MPEPQFDYAAGGVLPPAAANYNAYWQLMPPDPVPHEAVPAGETFHLPAGTYYLRQGELIAVTVPLEEAAQNMTFGEYVRYMREWRWRRPDPTEAVDERAREQMAEYARQVERERQAAEAARQRARDLLRACLSPAQFASYTEKNWFEVISNRGNTWRIMGASQSGNVLRMPGPGETPVARVYCAHPCDFLPLADAHLAQALALVTDEDAFVAVAINYGLTQLQTL